MSKIEKLAYIFVLKSGTRVKSMFVRFFALTTILRNI